jgi:hypothetical protein
MKCSVCGKRAHNMKGMVSYHDPSGKGKLQHAHKKCRPGQSKKPSPIKIPLITRHEKTASKNEEPVNEEVATETEAEGENKNRRARRTKTSG